MTAEHEDAEAGPVTTGSAPAAGGHRPKWVVPAALVLVVVLIGALVASIWFGTRVVRSFVAEQGRDHAVEAAKQMATNLTTFDSATAAADTKRLLDGTTPNYAAAFAGDEGEFLRGLHASQARSTGTVTEAGVLSYDPVTETAHILVTVRAQVANTAVPAGEGRDYRIELTMLERGRWLADQVEFLA
jgi:Mce-associated membrane protein